MGNCVKCKQPIEESKGTGRKKVYCSVACRRAAELEIRRINERITGLERITESYRLKIPVLDLYGKEEDVLAELNRQEIRLKELLAGMDG
ncbi:MAG: hypothetical protein JSS06_02050 [Proteobacteria bacterium]|nr:hypothetical protein [Pseudomonadota bacterium]